MLRPRSVSVRIMIVVFLASLPALAVTLSTILDIRADQTVALHDEALRAAEAASSEVEQVILGAESVLRALSAAPATRTGVSAACSPLMVEATRAVAFLSAIAILDAEGEVLCTSDLSLTRQDFAGRDYVAKALADDHRSLGLAETGQDGRLRIAIAVSEPVGDTRHIAAGFLDLGWLQRHLEERTLPPGGSLTIADPTGIVLARVPDAQGFVGTRVADDYLYLVKSQAPGTENVVSRDGTRRILGFIPPATNPSGLYISSGVSEAEGYAPVWSFVTRSVLIAGLGTLLPAILLIQAVRVYIARPIGRLVHTVAAWRQGDTAARTGLKAREGEICSAGESLDSFMDELLASREVRRRAEEAREMMRDEMEHRQKNLLATVQAVARQTFRGTGDEAALAAFAGRLNAISEANRLLRQSGWQSSSLDDLTCSVVATFVGTDRTRIRMTGPDVIVSGPVATSLAMAIHELCTNAVKFGALSNDAGTIDIAWSITGNGADRTFAWTWTERGGPPVRKPDSFGFGSKVIRHALATQTGGAVELLHEPDGLVCRFTASLQTILARPGL